jgi:hypothetical protein
MRADDIDKGQSVKRLLRTQFPGMDVRGLGNIPGVFPLGHRASGEELQSDGKGMTLPSNQHPEGSQQHAC